MSLWWPLPHLGVPTSVMFRAWTVSFYRSTEKLIAFSPLMSGSAHLSRQVRSQSHQVLFYSAMQGVLNIFGGDHKHILQISKNIRIKKILWKFPFSLVLREIWKKKFFFRQLKLPNQVFPKPWYTWYKFLVWYWKSVNTAQWKSTPVQNLLTHLFSGDETEYASCNAKEASGKCHLRRIRILSLHRLHWAGKPFKTQTCKNISLSNDQDVVRFQKGSKSTFKL